MKNLRKTLLAVLLAALITAIAGFWLFEINWPFLPFPLLAGLAIVLAQNVNKSYKFINKLIIGSLLYGFLAWLMIYSRMYFLVSDFPFWPLYNPKEYLIFSLVFSFISLLGGLIGVVLKGFYYILNLKSGK